MKLLVISLLIILFLLLLPNILAEKETIPIKKKTKLEVIKEATIFGEDYISLKSRQIIHSKGISTDIAAKIKAKIPNRVHILIQLDSIPNEKEREMLEENDIKLLSYIPNKAWFASVPSKDPEKIVALPIIGMIDEILPDDKISPEIKNGLDDWAVNNDGTVNLTVMFHEDVTLDEANQLISNNYGRVIGSSSLINALVIVVPNESIPNLANEDLIQWIEEVPPEPKTFNDGSRAVTGVDIVQASPYNLNGSVVVAGEWDGGWVDTTHGDLVGRVTIGDAGSATNEHATHVAGTMLGNGTLSVVNGGTPLQWRGMSTLATVISYEWWNDIAELNAEYTSAINTYGINLSTNSWGFSFAGADSYGRYTAETAEIDAIVRGAITRPVSIMWAAGNERAPPNGPCDSQPYDCIIMPGTAKNTITVGATNSNDDSMTSFSSWGPTNDGRLKPDLVAPGCQVGGDSGITSTIPGNLYGVKCGTSMSTPTVSGSVALLIQNYRNTHNTDPLPSTIKALLVHTSKDLGNVGPDYSFGYGRINVTAAVDLINNDTSTNDIIIEDVINTQGQGNLYEIQVPPGQSQLKVTLVWDDYKGTPNAAKELINDLNLELIAPNGTKYYPWVLNPSIPGDAATKGVDNLNNIEQVIVNPAAGKWQAGVKGATIPQPSQKYSLVSTNNLTKVQLGYIEVYLIDPISNKNVTKNAFFNFSSGVRCVGGECGNVTAILDPAAIYCTSSPCVATSAMIKSRDRIPPGPQPSEPNQPNTIDACTDGTLGRYLTDESIENITITDLDGTSFVIGDTIQVDVTAHCWTGGSANDNINFVYANNTATPLWKVKGFVSTCPSGGFNKLTKTWVLDSVTGNHTIRGLIEYRGTTTDTCGYGSGYDDADDVTIFVRATPLEKRVVPMNNGTPFYTINQNPVYAQNLTCLQIMKAGDSCNITWTVNATGDINTTHQFFVIYKPENYAGYVAENETNKINITIVSLAKFISITLIGYPVAFGNLDPAAIDFPAPGNDLNQYVIKVNPETNVNVDIYQKGNDFVKAGEVLGIGNMTWSTTNNVNTAQSVNSTYDVNFPIAVNVTTGTGINTYYWLSIPQAKAAGDYTANIFTKAVETGDTP